MVRLPGKGLSQPFSPPQLGRVGHRDTSQKWDDPPRKASFRKPPPWLRFDFAQKEFTRTPFPEWLCAMSFSLIICVTVHGGHYLHFMAEDTDGERVTW